MAVQVRPDIKRIKNHFAELPDPRSTINLRYLLVDVVVISLCGVLAGADGPVAIVVWAKANHDWPSARAA
jgi:hypothetical protein